MNSHDFLRGDNGGFATIRVVSESSHDVIMRGSISSDDAAAMEVDSQAASLPQEEEPDDQEASQETQPAGEASGATGSSGTSGLSPGTLLGVDVPSGLLAIEDVKPDEYYQASEQIRGALSQLPEQLRTWNSSCQSGFIPPRAPQTICSRRVSTPARPSREQVPG